MANISLDFLPKETKQQNANLFADLHLDLTINNVNGDQLHNTNTINDIKADYNIGAVRNSIINLLTTSPGEKILSPNYGLDLRYFLFEPCTEDIARDIADIILRQVPFYEPRVVIDNLDIEVIADAQTYNIEMTISIPSLKVNGLSLKGQLNNNGYVLI